MREILSVLDQKEANVRKQLSRFLHQHLHIEWGSYNLPGFGKMDLYAISPKYICIVEVELKRADPVNNVAKIYRYLEEDCSKFQGKKVIFVHAFSPYYSNGGGLTKRKTAEFIGNKMSERYENVAYLSIKFNSIESLESEVLSAIRSKIKV